jgi:hypothetical protein
MAHITSLMAIELGLMPQGPTPTRTVLRNGRLSANLTRSPKRCTSRRSTTATARRPRRRSRRPVRPHSHSRGLPTTNRPRTEPPVDRSATARRGSTPESEPTASSPRGFPHLTNDGSPRRSQRARPALLLGVSGALPFEGSAPREARRRACGIKRSAGSPWDPRRNHRPPFFRVFQCQPVIYARHSTAAATPPAGGACPD